MKTKYPESDLQISVMKWARCVRLGEGHVSDYLIAIPNGGNRNLREAARLKKEGVKAGVSDLFLAWPTNNYVGMWIELKAGKNKPTPAQQEWLDRMKKVGYHASVERELMDITALINNYIGEK